MIFLNLEEEIRKQALKNAFQHEGKASAGAVISKILGEFPEYRKNAGELTKLVNIELEKVNGMSTDEIAATVHVEFPEFEVKERKVQVHNLPELRNVKGAVVMRMAPSPSGPLHIGHSRMAILNDEYVKRYGGKLILRIEDTNPANIDPIAYEQIPKDLEWLGVTVHQIVIQSDRMEMYYEQARSLITAGHAYVCTCAPEDFKHKLSASIACPHRETAPEENLEKFQKMVDGTFSQGQAVLVIKTDLKHPNPSVRDWIAFRISDAVHPRHGKEYHAYPMMNFSVAVDDHLLGLTHVIRGKDHINNTEKQKYIFNYNNWKLPEYYHYGLVDFPGVILKTSIIKKGLAEGKYSGWDDIRLGTLLAFRKRGFMPETFRKYWIQSGMREIDSEFSVEIFNSINKDIIDSRTPRLFFVPNPVQIRIMGGKELSGKAPYHPSHPEMGYRSYALGDNPSVFIPSADWNSLPDGTELRLKDLCNVIKRETSAEFAGNAMKDRKTKIIQWAPENSHKFSIYRPDGTEDRGLIEPLADKYRGVAQLERYGYVNIASEHIGFFTHP
ncbi:MAG: glutamate--tRNA ligase [Thermoplasmataceae archaeon]